MDDWTPKELYAEAELTFSSDARCPCGAGLAHPTGCGSRHYWDCSDILMGLAILKDEPGSVQHTGQLPFTFYEIKSEAQPSAGGRTTRRAVVRSA